MLDTSDFMPLGKAELWSKDTATCHLSRCEVEGKSLLKKSLHPQLLKDEKLHACMRKEYETGKLLSAVTPYVVRYHQLIDTPEECAILMDFVDGLTLDEFMQVNPLYFLDEDRLNAFMCQLLEALKAFHHAQVVHLDLKPTNLLLTSVNNDLRVIDFGMSYFSIYPHTESLTMPFAAPEQMDGTGEVDCRTDIYAVGKILEYIEAKQKGESKRNRLPSIWQSVKQRCLESQKEDRWQNIEEIEAFLNDKMLQGKQKGKLRKWMQCAVMGLLLGVAGILAFSCMKCKRIL